MTTENEKYSQMNFDYTHELRLRRLESIIQESTEQMSQLKKDLTIILISIVGINMVCFCIMAIGYHWMG